MQWPPAGAIDNWARFGLAARVLKALANASVFLFLALPLVVLSNCGGEVARFTGYEALQSVSVSPLTGVEPAVSVGYGPDWWLVGIIVFAIVGLASAWRGGLAWSATGLGAAVLGFIALQLAINYFNAPPDADPTWSPAAGDGGGAIGTAFAGVAVLELGSINARSWYEVRRRKGSAYDNPWAALGCATTLVLIVIGLGVLVLIGLAVSLHG